MASIISEVIKDTIKEGTLRGITLTPQNYQQLFCEMAKKRGLSAPECHKLDEYISKLDASYQNELKKMPVRSESELFIYLSSRLNRSKNDGNNRLLAPLWSLTKRILTSIKLLHSKDASALASSAIQNLDGKLNETNINLIKDKWFDFLNNYDDSYLKPLEKYGVSASDDVRSIIHNILNADLEYAVNKDYSSIAKLFIASLAPSIATSVNDELATLSEQIRNAPEMIENANMQGDIKKFISKRISLDKEEFKNKIVSLDKILDEIESQIDLYIKKFGAQEDDAIKAIRRDLRELDGTNDEYESVKNKLEGVAERVNSSLQDFTAKLNSSKNTIKTLKEQIKELQEKLQKSAAEATNDFLTGLYTKRAFEAELARLEDEYIAKNSSYCLCFFDIDHFKNINDTYGHSAGDVILAKVGEIIAKGSRGMDICARFGGEEFVVILPLCELAKAREYAQRILSAIRSFEFIYKENKFSITISCGISERLKCASAKDCLDFADKMLYAAKHAGRNCVKDESDATL